MTVKKVRLLALILVAVVGLAGCRREQSEPEENEQAEINQTEERANRFLEESGVELPEGSERANLAPENESDATGVATRQVNEEQATVTVLASLPDLESGNYHGWLVTGENEYQYLGSLRMAKGGYMLEKSVSEEVSQNEIVVSRETAVGEAPSEVVLRGNF